MRLAIGKAADFSILAVHWAATFYSHLFENEHPPSQPFRNPLEVNFAPVWSVGRNKRVRSDRDLFSVTTHFLRCRAPIVQCGTPFERFSGPAQSIFDIFTPTSKMNTPLHGRFKTPLEVQKFDSFRSPERASEMNCNVVSLAKTSRGLHLRIDSAPFQGAEMVYPIVQSWQTFGRVDAACI